MKTNIVAYLMLLSCLPLFAQNPIAKNSWSLNGTVSFSTQSYEDGDDNRNVLILNPKVGYFLVNNLSLGISANYESISLGELSSTDWGIGPYLRYYFNLEKVYPFVSAGYNYTETDTQLGDDNLVVNQFIMSAGIDYFLTENVALETIFSYKFNNHKIPESYSSYYAKSEMSSNTFLIGVGLNIFLQ